MPNNGDIGDMPEFPVLRQTIQTMSTPHESIRKDHKENNNSPKVDNMFNLWTEIDEHVARLSKSDARDSNESLKKLWNDDYRRDSIQEQNLALQRYRNLAHVEFTEQEHLVTNLKNQIHQLQSQVIKSKACEEESKMLMRETHHAPPNELKFPPANRKRASSILPAGSSVKHAMAGPSPGNNNPSDLESSDNEEHSSTESDADATSNNKTKTRTKAQRKEKTTYLVQDHIDEPADAFGVDFLAMEPESDHDSDSDSTKQNKCQARQEYCAKLNLLKYQQSFIKNEPPFTYNSDANVQEMECKQDLKLPVWNYLQRLHNPADMVGDVDEKEMVHQFWMNCQPYIRASLVGKRLSITAPTMDNLPDSLIWILPCQRGKSAKVFYILPYVELPLEEEQTYK
ncbi:uncharacterized protein EDB93DRAFT_1109452 [Suillus bovinus]|uniref:uncharacterized protein n=1 Tax=Suillus bovinus TaxID=48563 RepID=UPI001B873B55|nr:uncharacterized protein EDB93DRAFT_1109452 [Suillus bovinus]KAG2127164.1 hypothetical protein EDB93DRAFT_1109452 [Suillus bovinus]